MFLDHPSVLGETSYIKQRMCTIYFSIILTAKVRVLIAEKKI